MKTLFGMESNEVCFRPARQAAGLRRDLVNSSRTNHVQAVQGDMVSPILMIYFPSTLISSVEPRNCIVYVTHVTYKIWLFPIYLKNVTNISHRLANEMEISEGETL